ncbi:MAG: DUF2760 domain-containing protein [Myxococcaceae bacterium]|nr:DUF2760 domain-containing protein [Myxococcaceae bacterium]
MSFFTRLKLALSILFGGDLPAPATPAPVLPAPEPRPALPPPSALSAEQQHSAALFMLGLLQREGRLLDFLQEDISSFSDGDIGAAARVVHAGCKKVLAQYLGVAPVVKDGEGAQVTVPTGFDASRFRLTGNVSGQGPWTGSLKHHGWVATKVELPEVPSTVDVKVIAPAEVELP